jgi:hypothetical protein
MPRKIWSGPMLPPPKFPGVAMESCLSSESSEFFGVRSSSESLLLHALHAHAHALHAACWVLRLLLAADC